MFEEFHNTIVQWLRENKRLEQVQSILQPLQSLNERHPETRKLWEQLIKSIIPKESYSFYLNYPPLFSTLLAEFLNLSQFASQQSVFSLVEQSFINILDSSALKKAKHTILDFHGQIPLWEDGTWHRQIQLARFETLPKLTRHAGFENDWQTAVFLTGCGYQYPTSHAGNLGWLRFSGQRESYNSWSDWTGHLKSITDTSQQIFSIDFMMETVFSPWPLVGMPQFCTTPSVCFECPLNSSCCYFQTRVKTATSATLENLLRLDEIDDIDPTQLIRYLAGDKFTQTPFQESLLNKYPDIVNIESEEVKTDSIDEQFLLFLKALKFLSDRQLTDTRPTGGIVYNKSETIFHEYKSEVENLNQEAFYTLILDNRYRKIHFKLITQGTLNRSLIHPREVFAPAIQLRAAAIILMHNHPSGDPQPSSQDIEITKRLIEVGNIVGINVIDHVIIGRDRYFSFVDEDLL